MKFAKTLHHILKLFPMLSLVSAFTIITFISCSNPTMSTNSIVISKNDSITLAYSDEDPFGLINNVKIEMINSGFSIVALEAAKTSINLDSQQNKTDNSKSTQAQISKSISYRSSYIMKIRYATNTSIWTYMTSIKTIQAELIDLNTGKILTVIDFEANTSSARKAAKNFVLHFSKVTKFNTVND